jgi:hypothetical protein
MFGFFKNVSRYQVAQKELSELLAPTGVNFMHLHPQITKFLVALTLQHNATYALQELDKATDMLQQKFPQLSTRDALIAFCTSANQLAGRS